MRLTMIDLCCGTGAFSIAAKKTGCFRTVYANDVDPVCAEMFHSNFPRVKIDIRPIGQVDVDDLPTPHIDLICAGAPCQPYSIEGKRQGLADPRANVFRQILMLAGQLRPRWLVCENVSGLLTMNGGAVFRTVRNNASKHLPGYQCAWQVYDTAKHTGIPHHRPRVYIIWFRDDSDFKAHQFIVPQNVKLKPVSSVLQSVSAVQSQERANEEPFYYSGSNGRESAWSRRFLQTVRSPVHGTNVVYQRRRDGVRQNKSGMVPCLTASMSSVREVPVIKDTHGVRMLTPRECFRLQGFSDTYKLPTTLRPSQLYKLAGNAVTVAVAELVLKSLVKKGGCKTSQRASIEQIVSKSTRRTRTPSIKRHRASKPGTRRRTQ
jgi:DNA (cytosine-5)-methyltransferase 1